MDRIAELAGRIKKASKITAFTGAGVSTESDIPDFRSAGGVYEKISREYSRQPEELLSHGFFMEHPDIFYDYLRKYLIFPDAKPNLGHRTLAALERAGKLVGVVTQNIDGLHQAAGCKKVFELHGSIYRNTCMRCGATMMAVINALCRKSYFPKAVKNSIIDVIRAHPPLP